MRIENLDIYGIQRVCILVYHCVAAQVGLASKQAGESNMSVVVYSLPVKEWSVQLEQTTSVVELLPFLCVHTCISCKQHLSMG